MIHFKVYFTLFLFLLYFTTTTAELSELSCKGNDVRQFNSYIRLISDTDEFNSDFKAQCNINALDTLNTKKDYVIDVGLRMSDTIKHDETDNDYVLFDLGPLTVQVNPDGLFVKSESIEKTCNVKVFQHEQAKGFTHDSVFYVRFIFKKKTFQLFYSVPKSSVWQPCITLSISAIAPRKLNVDAFSEFGINLDIVSFIVNPKKNPWKDEAHVEQLLSPLHKVEHVHEIDKLHKNVTKKEIQRLRYSISLLWYYDGFLTIVLIFMVFQYRKDSKKMHLF